MGKNIFKTVKRRRKEQKTDYKNRINLLKGGKPRVVFRKTNKYLIVQYITSNAAQDKIEFCVNSKGLLKYGWPVEAQGGLKSITASYLTGLLTGKKIISEKLNPPVVDLGMIRTLHKSKPYAFIKGLIDAGLEISCKEETIPSEERITGEHLKNKIKFDEIKKNILK